MSRRTEQGKGIGGHDNTDNPIPKGEAHPLIEESSTHLAVSKFQATVPWQQKRLQQKVPCSFLTAAWKRGARAAYRTTGLAGVLKGESNQCTSRYCSERQIVSRRMYQTWLQYSYITICQPMPSAISVFHLPIEGTKAGEHPMVESLIWQGLLKSRAPTPKYSTLHGHLEREPCNVYAISWGKQCNPHTETADAKDRHYTGNDQMQPGRQKLTACITVRHVQDFGDHVEFSLPLLIKTKKANDPSLATSCIAYETELPLNVTDCIRHSQRTTQHRTGDVTSCGWVTSGHREKLSTVQWLIGYSDSW